MRRLGHVCLHRARHSPAFRLCAFSGGFSPVQPDGPRALAPASFAPERFVLRPVAAFPRPPQGRVPASARPPAGTWAVADAGTAVRINIPSARQGNAGVVTCTCFRFAPVTPSRGVAASQGEFPFHALSSGRGFPEGLRHPRSRPAVSARPVRPRRRCPPSRRCRYCYCCY